MKKICSIIAGLLAAACLTGCGNQNAEISADSTQSTSSFSSSSSSGGLEETESSSSAESSTESAMVSSSSGSSSSENAADSSTESATESSFSESISESSAESSSSTTTVVTPESSDLAQISGLELASRIKVGWNLGNTFDASDCTWVNDEMLYESAWNGDMTTEKHIDMLKEAGFNAVRVPVSWHNHVSENYSISEKWLDRVNEVVDWCLERDMFVILNIHHDNSTGFMYPNNQYLEQSISYITAIWRQLAFRFKDYDERLIFEIMNEPRLVGHNNEWWIDPNNADCTEAISCINEINQAGVNTIRAAGGFNKTRFIMCPGYDASADGALNSGYILPTDPIANNSHIIVTVHAYTPYDFALNNGGTNQWSSANPSDMKNMTDFMDKIYDKFVSRGTAVIIDEFGARDKNLNTAARADFTKTYITEARKRGMPCFWWDNNAFSGNGELFGLLNRKNNSWQFTEIKDALVNN